MITEQTRILKQDGYLDVGSLTRGAAAAAAGAGASTGTSASPAATELDEMFIETRSILYIPNLNIICIFDNINQIKILDVHSGVILQTYQLGNGKKCVFSFAVYIYNIVKFV